MSESEVVHGLGVCQRVLRFSFSSMGLTFISDSKNSCMFTQSIYYSTQY